jgi:hypothetical protein
MSQNISNQPLNYFLNNLNYNVICLLPFNNDPYKVAAHRVLRNAKSFQTLSGENLLKWNVENEAQRIQPNNQDVIDAATNQIWNLKFTPSQRCQFKTLANDADTLYRIAQINTPRVADNPLVNEFYNGMDSRDDGDDIEISLQPAWRSGIL